MRIRIPSSLKTAGVACLLGLQPLLAQELEAEAERARASFMNILKLGLGVMTAVVMVSGLVLAAVKFARKDEGAMWYLIGTVGASVLLGAAAAFVG
jgi:nitrate reductase gamma subunit